MSSSAWPDRKEQTRGILNVDYSGVGSIFEAAGESGDTALLLNSKEHNKKDCKEEQQIQHED